MQITEYENKYLENIRNLLVELEKHIVEIDEDKLDIINKDYREKMALFDIEEVTKNDGKIFLAIERDEVVGLIMGIIRKWENKDYLDYKCPKTGVITELVVSKQYRRKGTGNELITKMEEYFRSIKCEYITVDVFAYNNSAIDFYNRNGYHNRMLKMIKKI